MIEPKYYKDLNHNYLIIKCEEASKNSYQIKMLTSNKIDGLLPCSTRYINADMYLYYEINSKQTLKNTYDFKKMDEGQVRRILQGFKRVQEEIQSFLLDDRSLIFAPEYIFLNVESEEISFLYYPGAGEDETGTIETFMEYLVEVIDHENEQLVDLVYGLCGLIQRGQFTIREMEYFMEQTAAAAGKSPAPESPEPEDTEIYEVPEEVTPERLRESSHSKQETHLNQEAEEVVLSKRNILAIILCTAGAASVLFLKNYYKLTPQENMISSIIFITFLLLAGAIISFYLLSVIKREWVKKRNLPKKDFYSEREGEGEYWNYSSPEAEGENTKEYGDTVFLSSVMDIKENKLYGINKGNKYRIDLNKLPCTIGKMAGCADYVIEDASISRMHARFTAKENTVFMTDLNSTNGTFKNGLRLEPNETVKIEPGDEIRIGKFTFCYR